MQSVLLLAASLVLAQTDAPEKAKVFRVYENRWVPIKNPGPILADFPEYVEPIKTEDRFEAPILIEDDDADLEVRAWRFSYNVRGILEVPNRLKAKATAIVVVHPWAVDDGKNLKSPEPMGAAFACTPKKNRLTMKHMEEAIDPFLKKHRGKVGLIAYSLPGVEDPMRGRMYRSIRKAPTEEDRKAGKADLDKLLGANPFQGKVVPERIVLSPDKPAVDYFKNFRGLDARDHFNGTGFWQLPMPVSAKIQVAPADVVAYDQEGYEVFRDFLRKQGIRHVLLAGYHTDMCVCATTAGYKNLMKDFNVFLVGDATLATFPAQDTPRFATTTAVSFASLDLFITQISWVKQRSAIAK